MEIKEVIRYLKERNYEYLENFPMSQFTSIRVGGRADLIFLPKNEEELINFIKEFRDKNLKITVLGEGTNVIVRDGGIRGVVISLKNLRGIRFVREGNFYLVHVKAGEPLPSLVKKGMTYGLSGIEKLAGIPGSVGGAISGNAGLHRKGIGEFVEEVELVTFYGRRRKFGKDEIEFTYRKTKFPVSGIIVEATLKFPIGDCGKIKEMVLENIKKKSDSQPLNLPSAGSVFKNPAGRKAWKLISDAGLRGLRLGGARISEKHANFIVNEGGATARDIETIIDLVKKRVKKVYGVEMEEEVKIIGEKK